MPETNTPGANADISAETLTKLLTWFSPAFPIGSFAYSHGLESAIASSAIHDSGTLSDWIADLIRFGFGRNDAILLKAAYQSPEDTSVAALASALQPSAERRTETLELGTAFAKAVSDIWHRPVAPSPYPVAVGHAARLHDVPLGETIYAYLHASTANLISVGVRLVPIGQTDGQRILTALSPLCREQSDAAQVSTLDDLGGCALLGDSAAMRHETLPVRVFKT